MDFNFDIDDILDFFGLKNILTKQKKDIKVSPQQDDQFYKDILTGIGAPINNKNLSVMYAWRQSEGGKAANNPFNTTKPMSNSTFYNCLKRSGGGCTIGVRNYKTRQDGVSATIKTLQNGLYGGVIGALKDNNKSAMDVAKEIKNSRWGTGDLIIKVLDGYIAGASPKPQPIPSSETKSVV